MEAMSQRDVYRRLRQKAQNAGLYFVAQKLGQFADDESLATPQDVLRIIEEMIDDAAKVKARQKLNNN